MIRTMLMLATVFMTGDAHLSNTTTGADSIAALVAAQIGTQQVLDCGDATEHATEAEYTKWWTLFPSGNFIPGERDWLDGCTHCVESINVGVDNVHLVGFDTHYYNDAGKLADLDDMLGGVSPAINVLFTHVPLLSANPAISSDVAAVFAAVEPVVDANDVELVVSGHGHAYERHHYHGRDYVVLGPAGAPLGTVGTAPTLITTVAAHGWLEITEQAGHLLVVFKGLDGTVLDQFATGYVTGVPDAPTAQQDSWGGVKALYR